MNNKSKLPDFLLGGAPKSATSSLYGILNCHNDIFIRGELDFFVIDDIDQHPQHFAMDEHGWLFHDYEADFEALLNWYTDLFQPARPGQKIGDYSTNYLASVKAPRRIHELLPDCKLIFMLRDPVQRAHSEYWHQLKYGRVTRSFEKALQYAPRNFIKNSCYKEAIQRYLRFFPRENIHFIIFERFIQDMQTATDEVCSFLDVSETVDTEELDTRKNTSVSPKWPGIQRLANRLFEQTVRRRRSRHLPDVADRPVGFGQRVKISLEGRFRGFNLEEKKNPPMTEDTRAFLEKLFAKENRGLSDLVGIDVGRYWSCM